MYKSRHMTTKAGAASVTLADAVRTRTFKCGGGIHALKMAIANIGRFSPTGCQHKLVNTKGIAFYVLTTGQVVKA